MRKKNASTRLEPQEARWIFGRQEAHKPMASIRHNQDNFNRWGQSPPAIFTTADLIDYMAAHHRECAAIYAQLAQWHKDQARILNNERRNPAANTGAALRETKGLLQ